MQQLFGQLVCGAPVERSLMTLTRAENSLKKYHCMAGLQFYRYEINCFTTTKYFLFWSNLVLLIGDQPGSDPSPNGEDSVPRVQ